MEEKGAVVRVQGAEGQEYVNCPKMGKPISLEFCRMIKLEMPEVWFPDCVFCEEF